ncbi:hypothetical protein DFH06DRAFT_1347953 [Mycena polygramma]|nr:hypothetical protein DFH06DRAFT_1347953 [Mycena polygramma]
MDPPLWPEEYTLHRASRQKYGPYKPSTTAAHPAPLRLQLSSRLQAFAGPCGAVTSIWNPVNALQSLAGTLALIPSDLDRTAPRSSPIRDVWSELLDATMADNSCRDIWRWMQFLQTLSTEGLRPRKISPMAEAVIQQSITHFLFGAFRLQGYCICYWFNNAGALGMVGNIWCYQAQRSILVPGTPNPKILHFALLSWSRYMYDTKGQDQAHAKYGQQLMSDTKKSPGELSSAALAYLVRDTKQRSREIIVYHLLVLLLLARTEPIQQFLMSQSSVHIVTRALFRVVRPRLVIRDEISDTIVMSSCTYLIKCLNTGDGLSCVVRAFEAGFLPSLLVGLRPTHSEFFPLLSSYLPPYLVYISVVRAAAKALKKIRKSGIEGRMQRRGPIADAWSTFKKALEERIELAGTKVHLVCASKQCNRVDYTDDCLRYCSGCMDRAYCSDECQVHDWRAGGHRKYCQETRALRKECKKIKLSAENIDFLTKSILERDRIQRTVEVFKIVHSNKTLAMEFDYTAFPMEVKPLDSPQGNPSYTLIQLKLPCGQQQRLLHVKYPMPRDVADSVISSGWAQ